jgi:hypothetical protein
MKSLIIVLVALVVGISSFVWAEKGPPWNTSEKDKEMYIKKYECPEATRVVNKVLNFWKEEILESFPENKALIKIYKDKKGSDATIFFINNKSTKKLVPIIGILNMQNKPERNIVEFHLLKQMVAAERAGIPEEEIKLGTAARQSTGKYFCFIN